MSSKSPKKKSTASRLFGMLFWPVLLIGGAALFWEPLLAVIYFASMGGNPSMTKAVDNRPQGYFYRFKASFSHKGEPLEFDYVVACDIRITSYRGGGTSNDSTFAPKIMMMPTGDGAAVMVRTIRACKGETTENGRAPEDLFPMAIWFDDVNDMTFGWGYASEDAYESDFSQLEFHGATIEVSNRMEWETWRESAAKDFKTIGMITTPWGMTYNEPWYGRGRKKPYDDSRRFVARLCRGYYRQKIPKNIADEIAEKSPSGRSQYWSPERNIEGDVRAIIETGKYSAESSRRFIFGQSPPSSYGLPTRKGMGTVRYWGKAYPREVYPMLPRSRSTIPTIDKPADEYPRRLLFRTGSMKGFMACGGDARGDKFIRHLDSDFLTKKHPVYVDDELVQNSQSSSGLPSLIFGRDGYVFSQGPPGWGGL